MKAVILAGGFGTRLSEATNLIPKPMVEIGGKPTLRHIRKLSVTIELMSLLFVVDKNNILLKNVLPIISGIIQI